jgi:sugar lactone lactonase YvrE
MLSDRSLDADPSGENNYMHFLVRTILALTLAVISAETRPSSAQTIETIAGTGDGIDGGDGGPALETSLIQPFDLELGPDGALYFCEFGAHRVRKLDLQTHRISNVAGTGKAGYSGDGGPATAASMNQPHELRFDRQGNLYVTDMLNHAIRKIAANTGVITTVAGMGKAGFSGDSGPANRAQLNSPHSICLDDHDRLYIADVGNHRVRRIDLATGRIETVAGSGEKRLPRDGGPIAGQPLFGPRAICIVDGELWVALREGHSVWRLDFKNGTLHRVAGNGKPGYRVDHGAAKEALVNSPKGLDLGPDGRVYLADTSNHCIRAIDPRYMTIETIAGRGGVKGFAGDGGPAANALLNNPHGIGFGRAGEIFIGDSDNHRVRVIVPKK